MNRSLVPFFASTGIAFFFAASSCGARDTRGGSDASTDAGPLNDAGTPNDGGDAGDGGANSLPSFTVQSPEIDVPAGTELVTCYYFRTPNDAGINVKTWKSTLTTGVADVSLLFTAADIATPGTVTENGCTMLGDFMAPSTWAYTTHKASDGWSFPADDGTGKPVANPVKAQQPGYLLIHAVNPTNATLKVQATLEATGYALGTVVTQAESFVTFNSAISIPPMGSSSAVNTCPVPAGAHFSYLTTFSRKKSVQTQVKDMMTTLFESTDFENPGATTWAQAPFGAFTSNHVTVQCDYVNVGNNMITAGDSLSDEACMVLGFHFPATKSRLCINNTLLP